MEENLTRVCEDLRGEIDQMSKLLVRRDIELINANERLEKLDRTKSEFVSIAAHQLRTPLTSMSWFAEILLNDTSLELSTDQRSYLENIHKSSIRLAELIRALLNVSQLELGTIENNITSFSVRNLVEKNIEKYKGLSFKKNIDLHATFDLQDERIMIDKMLLEMILDNLITNALKYTEHGSVSIFVKTQDARCILEVSDTGQGIPEEDLPQIFNKFFRGSNVSDGTNGTGLGLYIVKMATEKLKGDIGITSTVDKGTTFHIDIPLTAQYNHFAKMQS